MEKCRISSAQLDQRTEEIVVINKGGEALAKKIEMQVLHDPVGRPYPGPCLMPR